MNSIRITEDKCLLSTLTRACKLKNDKIKTRLPISRDMLHILLKSVWDDMLKINHVYLAHLYTTILITMFYGMFRIGELTLGSHPVLANDVHIGMNKEKMLFVLHTSKTHGKGSKPQKIKIQKLSKITDSERRSNNWCPF